MATKQAVKVLKAFNRNLDGQMVVGHPKHSDFRGRYILLSQEAAASLVDRGLAEEIDAQTYHAALARYEDGRDDEDRPLADDVRLRRTGGAGANRDQDKAKVTMSIKRLEELAAKRGVDISEARNNKERVALINGAGPGGDAGDETDRGRLASMTTNSTNHPPGSDGHGAGLASVDDAAPTGGAGAT